jgi:hypothetical protein
MDGRELMHLRGRSGPVIRTAVRGTAKRNAIEQEIDMEEAYADLEDYIPAGDPVIDRLADLDGPTEEDLRELDELLAGDDLRDPDDVEVDLFDDGRDTDDE